MESGALHSPLSTLHSVSRPSLLVEDDAAFAGRTNQPLPRSSVPQPERSAADRSRRELPFVPRTDRLITTGERLPDLMFFFGRILRSLRHALTMRDQERMRR